MHVPLRAVWELNYMYNMSLRVTGSAPDCCSLNVCTSISLLFLLHREGHVGVAEFLLEVGADVETPDNYGQSPFFMACWKGHSAVASLLLEFDANKDCRTKTGITPLFQVM